mmetsp:Transcript_33876/g.24922  ORF Transcript_33876/g.24922 Transcript_33876/m.24922 type:complete len:137 (+) Transcript_33876:2982-3392(+)
MEIDFEKGSFKEINFNFIPLYDKEYCKQYHVILDRKGLELYEIHERLLRNYQFYKRAYFMEGKVTPGEMYPELFYVDFKVGDEVDHRVVGDLSFSYLHWILIEQLAEESMQIDWIDESQIQLLIYNILPGGNTVMH